MPTTQGTPSEALPNDSYDTHRREFQRNRDQTRGDARVCVRTRERVGGERDEECDERSRCTLVTFSSGPVSSSSSSRRKHARAFSKFETRGFLTGTPPSSALPRKSASSFLRACRLPRLSPPPLPAFLTFTHSSLLLPRPFPPFLA